MKRAYPAIKFVRPRSTSGGKTGASAGPERCPPPLPTETATAPPALAKRKRPTTQSWKGPRRRLDPPSPFKSQQQQKQQEQQQRQQQRSKTNSTKVDGGQPTIGARSSRGTLPPAEKSNGSTSFTARTPISDRAAAELVEEPSRTTPDTLVTRKYSNSKAFVMVAETPTRPRGHPSRSRPMASFDKHRMEPMEGLRIPDTPDPKAKPKAEKKRRATTAGGAMRGGDSCSSYLSSPALAGLCLEVEQEREPGVVGGVGVTSAGACADLPSSSGESREGSESESPDLLRSYTMGAKADSQQPTRIVARNHLSSRSSSTGVAAAGIGLGQSASEESDTGSDSPDLLRAYAPVGTAVLEESQQTVVVAAGEAAGKKAATDSTSNLPNARPPDVKRCRIPRTTGPAEGSDESHQGGQGKRAGRGGTVHVEESTERLGSLSEIGPGRQTSFTRWETKPRQEMPQTHSYGLDTHPASPPVKTRSPPALLTHDGGDGTTSRKLGGTATGGSLPLDEARGGCAEGKAPAEKKAYRGEGAGNCAVRGGEGGPSTVPWPDLLLLGGESTEARSRAQKAQGVTVRCGSRKLPTPPTAAESMGGSGDTACNPGPMQNDNTRPPILNTASIAGKMPGKVDRALPTVNSQPAPGPAVKDTRVAAAGANNHGTKCVFPASAAKDAGRVPGGVFNPYSSAVGRTTARDPAAGRVFSGVSNPYHATGASSRGPAPSVPLRQVPKTASKIESRQSEDPTARVKSSQTPSYAGGSSDGSSPTPPEVRFETARQQLYKNPRSAGATGREGRGRGRGRGGGRGAGRGGKRGSMAPRPAQNALVGVWRTERARKKGERSTRFYMTLSGQKLTGREATRAAEQDKKVVKDGHGPSAKDRSIIMRIGQGAEAESRQEACDEKCLHEDALKLGTYGIPEQLVESYAKRGIRGLFLWQAHCLRVDDGKPLAGGNLVYSAPTSGGKTLVAELLLLRALLKHDGTMALLVVPYVALALEKRDYFRDVWSPLQLNVQAYHGGEGGDENDMEGVNVAICTMEKANSIVNRLAEEKRLQALSAVVVDEMHLIGDTARGFLLELMLTKQRLLCPHNVQLVCLSATLPNIECLAKWLDASLYRTHYRPVELRHFVCTGRAVYRPSRISGTGAQNGGGEMTLEKVAGGGIKKVGGTSPISDPDGVVDLVKDALARDMSVLVFCSTKKWCQQTANLLAKEVLLDRNRAAAMASAAAAAAGKKCNANSNSLGRSKGKASLVGFGRAKSIAPAGAGAAVAKSTELRSGEREGMVAATQLGTGATETVAATAKEGSAAERLRPACPTAADTVRERLRQTPVGLDAELSYLVGAGIAFHHSGLVVEERSILEDAFRQGSLRVLVATSTLAAGVNLPAHRVIIRSPSIGIGPLDSTRYHQMAGRSGRAGVHRGKEGGRAAQGIDVAGGESFLILPKNVKFTLSDASSLISAPLPKLESALRDAKGGGLERALLEVVVSKTVTSRAGARRFCSRTLLAAQIMEGVLHKACDSAVECLLEHNFIVKSGGSGEGCVDYDLAPTQLGRATFFSGLSPSAAVDVFQSLDKACQNFAVASELHALVLVTPLEGIEPNWERFREEYLACSKDDPVRVVGGLIGIELGVLVSAAGHTGPKYGRRYYETSRGRTVDLQPYRRLYGAMLLQQAVEEVPVRNMAVRLGIERGALQALQKEASVFCGMVVCFCRHLQWHELANVLYSFQDRLGYSAKPELLPLVRLSRDLPPFRARALREAGYPSPIELATAEAARVADVLLRCAPFRSVGWDESVERHRAKHAGRLAENVIRLASAEVMRQIRRQLVNSAPA